MTQKTVVFDFGGVLFDSSITDFYRERFLKTGRTEEDLEHFLSHVFTKQDRSASNSGDARDLICRKVSEHPAWADDIRAFGADADFIKTIRSILPGMQEVVEDLAAAGYSIMGLTNWHGDTYDLLPKAFPQLMDHFNTVVVSGKIHLRKPDPEIFRQANAAFGNPAPADVYYFDDKAANVAAAKNTVGWNGFTFKNAETVRQALVLKPRQP